MKYDIDTVAARIACANQSSVARFFPKTKTAVFHGGFFSRLA